MTLLLPVLTLAVYAPVLNGGFLQTWDDTNWMSQVDRLRAETGGFLRMWLQPGAMEQFYPLTGASFWLDRMWWGEWPLPYHVENVLLHATAALLLALALRRMGLTTAAAWLAAYLFALHPVMVESVAWITERKNVLSMPLFLGAVLASGGFASWAEGKHDWHRALSYAACLMLFLAAVMAKASAVVFPVLILLLGWWRKGKVSWRGDGLAMLPFFAVAAAVALAVRHLEVEVMGARGEDWNLSPLEKALVAGRALWFYLGKLTLPVGVCAVYPRWEPNAVWWWHWLPALGFAGLLALLYRWRARLGRGPLTAVLWFAIALAPVLGFIPVYGMIYSWVADRWVYLAAPGWLALLAAILDRMSRRCATPVMRAALLAAAPLLLAAVTWKSSARFCDDKTLWTATLRLNPDCWLAHQSLGVVLRGEGRHEEAVAAFERALALRPGLIAAHNNLGNTLIDMGRLDEAVRLFRRAIALHPGLHVTHHNLGNAWLRLNDGAAAEAAFREALRLAPDYLPSLRQLGDLLELQGRREEACEVYLATLEKHPQDVNARVSLGNMAFAEGRQREARAHYEAALAAAPNDAVILNNLAWLLSTATTADLRDGKRAVELARRALAAPGTPILEYEHTLAAALAEAGEVDAALTTAQAAADKAAKAGRHDLAHALEALQTRLARKRAAPGP